MKLSGSNLVIARQAISKQIDRRVDDLNHYVNGTGPWQSIMTEDHVELKIQLLIDEATLHDKIEKELARIGVR